MMADKDKMADPAKQPVATQSRQLEEQIRSARDSLPGQRDGLPKAALGGLPADPQADENREPPADAPTIPQ
jgi:hypothetical protein